ncbi:Unknown protein, partial [Striga hermonthica]
SPSYLGIRESITVVDRTIRCVIRIQSKATMTHSFAKILFSILSRERFPSSSRTYREQLESMKEAVNRGLVDARQLCSLIELLSSYRLAVLYDKKILVLLYDKKKIELCFKLLLLANFRVLIIS